MHNNAEFLSRLSSNVYEFDKREMLFYSGLTEHSSHKNFVSSKGLFQENEIV